MDPKKRQDVAAEEPQKTKDADACSTRTGSSHTTSKDSSDSTSTDQTSTYVSFPTFVPNEPETDEKDRPKRKKKPRRESGTCSRVLFAHEDGNLSAADFGITIWLSPETSEELYQGFSTSKLPLTFRDAIEVTYSIGVQYLWMDSLCVVQGSEEDKVRESASMDRIFGNAFLALIAANSSDCKDGFFE
ncbi:HET domain-containing protein, partial [Colletotrichum sojae]